MSKHKRKRFLSILITAVLVFTLALSSVMAQDDEHVRTDKLSVEGEDVEVMEGIASEDDVEVVADEAITEGDAEAEEADADEAADDEEISAEDAAEEADADVSEAAEDDAETDAGIMTLSVGDVEDEDDYGIQTLADTTVTSGLQNAIDAAGSGDTITLGADIQESVTIASGQNITLDLNGYTLTGDGSTVITVEGTLTLEDSVGTGTITGGSTSNKPGGVEVTGTFIMNGGSISGNSSTHGGVGVYDGGSFTLNNGSISNNTASSGSGAGVYVESATFTMTGGTISGNTASNYGGGVDITCNGSDSTFTMTGGTISENTASSQRGGGVFVENKSGGESTFDMSGGTISENSDSSYGAGVTVNGATLNLSDSALITNNNGRNVYLYDSTAELNMSGGTISYGSASSGGGVYVAAGTFNMSGGVISDNTATVSSNVAGGGGIYVTGSSSSFNMTGGEISGNEASSGLGGGVDIHSSATFTMSGGSISGNKSSSSGGGVQLLNATFIMNNGSISENTASDGGAINVTDGGDFTMTGGSITDNEASGQGGGVHVWSGSFTMSGGSVKGNTATGHAGGVNIPQSSSIVTISGTAVVTDNTSGADGEKTADNVYLSSGLTFTLGSKLSGSQQIGVTTATAVTETSPVQFTTTESSTAYYSTSNQYFFSDKEKDDDTGYAIGVRVNQDTTQNYLELYEVTRPTFEATYLVDEDNNLYTSANATNYLQILSGANDWDLLTDTEKEQVTADLTEANGGEYLDYPMLLAAAQAIADEVNAFENSYLNGEGELYTSVDENNMADILAGAADWANMSDEAKAAVNADLTAANNGVELTYDDLLAQAFELAYLTDENGDGLYTTVTADNMDQILSGAADWENMSDDAKDAVNAALQEASGDSSLTYDDLLAQAFQQKYLTDEDGNGPYTAATADNYEQILAGADDWDAMSDEAKEAVNKALQEASGDPDLDYPTLLAQAQAYSAAADFIYSYVSDSDADNPYLEATVDNYLQILSGEDAWNAMSAEEQDAVNAILTAANGGEELTYPMLLEQAKAQAAAVEFEEKYLTGDDGVLYTAATADNYAQILAGTSDWAGMSDAEKAAVNADLTAANGGVPLTYDDLLAQAFELAYLTDDSGNGPYTAATPDNMDQILAGADDWNALSDEAKEAVNKALQEASGDSSLTYDDLLAAAFELKYLMGSDGNLYTEVTADNYEQILAGEADWNRLSPEAQALVNAHLTAANGGELLTYPMLLEQAKAFAASLGNVKTGDNTHLYLYVILAAAAAAAAAGAAVYRRRRI